MKILFLLVTLALGLITPLALAAKTCSRSDGIRAEEAVDHLNSWSDIHAAFVRFAPQCDDGGIAEGYSDRVVHLLATKWESLSELEVMTRKDVAFKRFVLSHIDATADTDELRAIARQSMADCTKQNQRFCKQLGYAASEAIKEDERFEQAPG